MAQLAAIVIVTFVKEDQSTYFFRSSSSCADDHDPQPHEHDHEFYFFVISIELEDFRTIWIGTIFKG